LATKSSDGFADGNQNLKSTHEIAQRRSDATANQNFTTTLALQRPSRCPRCGLMAPETAFAEPTWRCKTTTDWLPQIRKRKMAKQPAHEIRFGLIKATVWQNQTKVGDRFNVTVSRLYRNGDRWVESQHFGRDDLLLVAKTLDLAHTWIFQQNGERSER
jgi:hypothetical protein